MNRLMLFIRDLALVETSLNDPIPLSESSSHLGPSKKERVLQLIPNGIIKVNVNTDRRVSREQCRKRRGKKRSPDALPHFLVYSIKHVMRNGKSK